MGVSGAQEQFSKVVHISLAQTVPGYWPAYHSPIKQNCRASCKAEGKGRGLSLTSHMAEPARKEGAAALTEVFGWRRVRALERP